MSPAKAATPLELWLSVAAGFTLISIANLVTTAFFAHSRSLGLGLERVVWDLMLTTSVGAFWGGAMALVTMALRRVAPWRPGVIAFVLHGLATTAVVYLVWQPSLERQADVMVSGAFARPLEVALHAGTGFGIPLAHVLGSLCARRWWLKWPAFVVGFGATCANAAIYRDDLFDSHCIGAAAAAMFLAGAVRIDLGRWMDVDARRRRIVVSFIGFTLLTLFAHPANAIRLEVFRGPAALGAWAHASTIWRLPSVPTDLPLTVDGAWVASREGLAPRPPSAERLVQGAPIVVFITIDAVRADVVLDPANDAMLPHLAELKRDGVVFTMARSAGSQTAVSLTAVFTGRYFSELAWSKHGRGASRFDYAADNPAPRFPAILSAQGVGTVKFGPIKFLANDFGVAGGFAEERMAVDDRRHAMAAEVVDPLIAHLEGAGPEPLFLYAHLMEPHAPYDRGKVRTGPAFERYKSEVAEADRSIGKIIHAAASAKLSGRVLLVVSSDHGEAFGEHGTTEHSKTLYDELLRVPLLVKGPGVVPRRIAQPVGLIDLGATFLDVFGVDTPPTFMGESLVPLLAGRDVELTRPLFAEGRQRRVLVAGDTKVIVDLRRKVVEAFDLAHDPKEEQNLFDVDPKRAMPALSTLVRFFAAHQSKNMPGMPVYKP